MWSMGFKRRGEISWASLGTLVLSEVVDPLAQDLLPSLDWKSQSDEAVGRHCGVNGAIGSENGNVFHSAGCDFGWFGGEAEFVDGGGDFDGVSMPAHWLGGSLGEVEEAGLRLSDKEVEGARHFGGRGRH